MATEKIAAAVQLEAPRMKDGRQILLAGSREHYTDATVKDIPAQWQRLSPLFRRIPWQVDRAAYGVVFNTRKGASGFDYMAGIEVSDFAELDEEFARLHIPAQRYVVFPHRGHVSTLKDTMCAIWNTWLPASGHVLPKPTGEEPGMIEYYGENFDPRTGIGDIEVWVPIVS